MINDLFCLECGRGMCACSGITLADHSSRQVNQSDLLRLISLMLECKAWGEANGYPASRHYPQYQHLRELGLKFHTEGGHSWMAKMSQLMAQEVDGIEDPDWSSAGFLSFCWSGIGDWMP